MEGQFQDSVAGDDLGTLSELYSGSVAEPRLVRALLTSVVECKGVFAGRRTLRGFGETVIPQRLTADRIVARTEHIELAEGKMLVLGFDAGGRSYSFTTRVLSVGERGASEFEIPSIVFLRDRRDCPRRGFDAVDAPTARIELDTGVNLQAAIRDLSAGGISLQCYAEGAPRQFESVKAVYSDDAGRTLTRWAQVRHVESTDERSLRIGLATSDVPYGPPISVDHRTDILSRDATGMIRARAAAIAFGARAAASQMRQRLGRRSDLPRLEVVDFCNQKDEKIRGIVDRAGPQNETTGVIIPPAWGRTKETLMPLARTICAAYERAGQGVVVLRFDGIRRRGESHNDPGCNAPGQEHCNFTLSQAVSDIESAATFLRTDASTRVTQVALVTFSAASIEGRRAVQRSSGAAIDAWVSVVGAPDLQSGMRTVSGGIDYFGGADRGLKFGVQEIMGVAADIDKLADDALRNKLVFLEDARRDMFDVDVPVTWIHGSHDAWLDLNRVREIMSCGDQSRRRLLVVPTGHQLQSSREALEVFQLVALELLRLRSDARGSLALPDPGDLGRRRSAERERLSAPAIDLPQFWKDYLVGRDGSLGIELMNATAAYCALMKTQIEGLQLKNGEIVADLGSGTGPFAAEIVRSGHPNSLTIEMYDYVQEALDKTKERLSEQAPDQIRLSFHLQDLESSDLADRIGRNRFDAVLSSLVLSYVRDPEALLEQIFLILKPRGRVVVSSLRRDADVSKLYLEGIEELKRGRGREEFGFLGEQRLARSAQQFLNDAARLLDLEEYGEFRFWDAEELERMIVGAGFSDVSTRAEFGVPPQAFVVQARRP